MARDITTINQTNLWGKQADPVTALEPQRTDLWFLDFKEAKQKVATASKTLLSFDLLPQYCRSVTLPEFRTKADAIRRDSIPFQMPSWDDPMDPVKVQFLLDTRDQDDTSYVIDFLDAWLALTRAGRGSRWMGFNAATGWMTLNADYRVDFQFNIMLYLLRGAEPILGGFTTTSDSEVRQNIANWNTIFRNRQKAAGLIQQGDPVEPPANTAQIPAGPPTAIEAVAQDMVIHTVYELSNAWLGAYKISDLSYLQSELVTVDATFYVDNLTLSTRHEYTGEPAIPS